MTTTQAAPAFLGMDTEQVADAARRLLADADRLDEVTTRLRARVDGMAARAWWGRDCAAFCEGWQQVHDPSLVATAEALRRLGRRALAEVDQQERASGSVAGPSGGTGAPAVAPAAPAAVRTARDADRDLLVLATGVYPGGSIEGAGGRYTAVGADELRRLGVTPSMLRDDASGFAASVFRGADGRYVLAFRGSDGGPLSSAAANTDWFGSNLQNTLGLPSTQGGQAVALATRLERAVGEGNLDFTGHSLGGHLASAAAVATGGRATTFNAAGLGDGDFARALIASGRDGHVPEVLAKNALRAASPLGPFHLVDPFAAERRQILESGQIRNYSTQGEFLMRAQGLRFAPAPLGQQVPMVDPAGGIVTRHGPDGLVETFDSSFRRGRP